MCHYLVGRVQNIFIGVATNLARKVKPVPTGDEGGGADHAHHIGLSPPRFLKLRRPWSEELAI